MTALKTLVSAQVLEPVADEKATLRKSCLSFVAKMLTSPQDIIIYHKLFAILDWTGADNKINARDLFEALDRIDKELFEKVSEDELFNVTLEITENIVAAVDLDGNGEIDYWDFLVAITDTSRSVDD